MFQRLGIVAATTAVAVVGGGGAAVAVPATESTAENAPNGIPHARAVTDVAHRGASGHAPENTLAAIDEASEHNATTVEVDVQQSSDGELVIIHDTTLERTTDVEEVYPDRDSYDVADFTLGELKELDAGSWFDDAYAGEPIPTLEEVLDRLAEHRINLLLEIKSPSLYPGIESNVADTLRDNPRWLAPGGGGEAHRLVIQSFDWESTERSHAELPWVTHGLLGEVPEDEIAEYATWADQINPDHTTLDSDYVDAVHEADTEVFPYTMNDAESIRSVIGKGADGVISDYPDVAREVIEEKDGVRLPRPIPIPTPTLP